VKAPRFTIVTVSLNAGESLRETALSVLSQDCPDFEYLVQDGGSTDGSLAALPQDPRLRVIVEKDEGIYDAMNRAARRATGDYLNFLNAGDRFAEAGTLSSVAAILDASVPAPDLVYGDSIDERSAKVRRAPATFNRRALFLEGICHQAQWLRRETFLSLGGLDTTFRFRADHELLLRLAERGGEAVHVARTLALYDGRGFSAARGNRAGLDAEWAALRRSRYTLSERLAWGGAAAARMLWLKRLLLDLASRLAPSWLERRRASARK
jgi:glycosyltransferase involved in cell wall biosynthesis